MRFDVLTLFPAMFTGPLTESIIKRAVQAGHISIGVHDIRAYATDRHRTADDTPYGGGAGMVMKAAPLAAAIRDVQTMWRPPVPVFLDDDVHQPAPPVRQRVLLMSPAGRPFTQRVAEELAQYQRLIMVCGRYEGVDERVCDALIDDAVSIGDYVLTGGELAAMVLLDAASRLVPGVLDTESVVEESFSDDLLEYPHYTRPASWEGRDVPHVLLSGNHAAIARWRRDQRLLRTMHRRPDLLRRVTLDAADRAFLLRHGWDE